MNRDRMGWWAVVRRVGGTEAAQTGIPAFHPTFLGAGRSSRTLRKLNPVRLLVK